jgi:mRNA interferase RelE/StbE
MQIKYAIKALKFLAKMDKTVVSNIRDAISGLTMTPPQGDIKPLVGYKDGRKRLRIGKYRVVFRYDEELKGITILYIMNIGSRGDIYKEV